MGNSLKNIQFEKLQLKYCFLNMAHADGIKLFVYGISADCPKDILEDKFGKFGRVNDVYNTGKGYAFITMDDERGAKDAIDDLHGSTIEGQEVKVEMSRPKGSGGRDRDRGYGGGRDRRGGGGGFDRHGGGGRGRNGGRRDYRGGGGRRDDHDDRRGDRDRSYNRRDDYWTGYKFSSITKTQYC